MKQLKQGSLMEFIISGAILLNWYESSFIKTRIQKEFADLSIKEIDMVSKMCRAELETGIRLEAGE